MPPDTLTLFGRLAAALAIGLLVGLQREYAQHQDPDDADLFAGVRTFALIAFTGALGAYVSALTGSALVFPALLLLVGVFVVVAYIMAAQRGDVGLTTEVAALVTLLAGALCGWGALALGAAVGVVTTLLLALKLKTQKLARAVSPEDVVATLKFAAVTVLVLPVLPDEPIGPAPLDVVSPFNVWLMVVFISGISFVGYVLVKVLGPRRGVGLAGVIGGLASSTALTLTFAERSRGSDLARPLALGVMMAWAIMFARVLVEAGAVNPPLLGAVWLPIAAGGVAALAYAALLYARSQSAEADGDDSHFANPFRLKSALVFGLLYGVILVVSRAAEMHFGTAGVYVSAVASGLADVDAITLSMAELSRGEEGLAHETAALAIVLAAASNTLVKGGMVIVLGSAALRRAILPGLALILGVMLGVGLLV